MGTLSSALGGFLVGVAYYCTLIVCSSNDRLNDSPPQWPLIVIGALGGVLGSAIDSILGATFQYSGKLLFHSSITSSPTPPPIRSLQVED